MNPAQIVLFVFAWLVWISLGALFLGLFPRKRRTPAVDPAEGAPVAAPPTLREEVNK